MATCVRARSADAEAERTLVCAAVTAAPVLSAAAWAVSTRSFETARASEFAVGDCLYGIPWHICPTVALHSEAFVVQEGRATTRWKITARARRLTI